LKDLDNLKDNLKKFWRCFRPSKPKKESQKLFKNSECYNSFSHYQVSTVELTLNRMQLNDGHEVCIKCATLR
jgi:hypothetical protein